MNQINFNLSEEQKRVLFKKGTETPGTGKYLQYKEIGTYLCANCSARLFSSDTKYDSRTPGLIGWPSFSNAVDGSVDFLPDNNYDMERIEVICKKCGAHLGHVFNADDSSSGKHYCINSVCLEFKPASEKLEKHR